MITIDIETLGVTVVPQMYTRVGTHSWRYISLLTGKEVNVNVDEHGFVIDEPGSFKREVMS